ncbi:uracil-DNA glycosylase family protein [Pedobacter nutrimenti]|jgi:hypothetical protein|uniref:Uncharacterized protein DUF4918 n=1 Tax=Pedobacter nutrimenti TaxID=1241337 RepID=A0A318UCK4_9SPHI|nr:uracil-DNA glycosylase family protein [Pedobacter nutrimenti]PYF71519.1 uncharacterized protein DUF4918 [Pedobacter nutrimenti]
MQKTFADRVIDFYKGLSYQIALPEGVEILNPYLHDARVMELARHFYQKFYHDQKLRHLIIGINPGRFGGAVTGIPFTDPKRLQENCGLAYTGPLTHEPSSVFVYDMIEAFGGVDLFYSKFYINSVFPLALTFRGKNYNYYDDKQLTALLLPVILENIENQIALGICREVCYCLGLKNYTFLNRINKEYNFFDKIIPLEHPRYIVQYQHKNEKFFLDKYLAVLKENPINSF